MAGKNPSTQWYWNDWETDECLRLCGPAAHGLWMRMLVICARAEPIGYLMTVGRPCTLDDLSRLTGWRVDQIDEPLADLEHNQVFSRTRDGIIYNRRMVRQSRPSAAGSAPLTDAERARRYRQRKRHEMAASRDGQRDVTRHGDRHETSRNRHESGCGSALGENENPDRHADSLDSISPRESENQQQQRSLDTAREGQAEAAAAAALARRIFDEVLGKEAEAVMFGVGRCRAWLAAGYDAELVILPTIRVRTQRRRVHDPGWLPRGFDYFDAALAEAHAQSLRPGLEEVGNVVRIDAGAAGARYAGGNGPAMSGFTAGVLEAVHRAEMEQRHRR